MKKKNWIRVCLIIFLLAAISGICAVVALASREEDLSRISLFATLLFGYASLIFSLLALSFTIQDFCDRRKKEKDETVEKANCFINQNGDQIVYLPLCLMANCFDPHHKYLRNIYNSFAILSLNVKKAVLKELGYDFDLSKNGDWIYKGLDIVEKVIRNYDLGTNILEERDELFKESLTFAEFSFEPVCENEKCMPDIFNPDPKRALDKNGILNIENTNFYSFLIHYVNARRENSPLYMEYSNNKPIDYFATIKNMNNSQIEDVCSLTLQMIEMICIFQRKSIWRSEDDKLKCSDAKIETMEDELLKLLLCVYNLYHLEMK